MKINSFVLLEIKVRLLFTI